MIRQFIWLEPGLIFALILANGFFAAVCQSGGGLMSARPTRAGSGNFQT